MKAIREQHRNGLLATSRNRRCLILRLAALLSFALPWVSPATATASCTDPAGCWATKAPMPTARYALATAVVNGIVYAMNATGSGLVSCILRLHYASYCQPVGKQVLIQETEPLPLSLINQTRICWSSWPNYPSSAHGTPHEKLL